MDSKRTNLLLLLCGIAAAIVIVVEGARLLPVAGRIIPVLDANAFNMGDITRHDLATFWRLDPDISEINRPIPGVENPQWEFRTNSIGLRGGEITKKGGRVRILALGDSTTFGIGVNEEETWPAKLQAALGAEFVEVINAGTPGCTSFQGLCFLLTQGFEFQPDLVIVTYAFNDMREAPFNDIEAALSNLWTTGFSQRQLVQGMDATAKEDTRHRRRLTEGEFLDAMIEIGMASRRKGAEVLYLSWPYEYAITHGVNPEDYWNLFPYLSDATKAPYIDLVEVFKNAEERPYLDDIHANKSGCELVAQRIARHITEKQMLSNVKGQP